MSKLNVVEGTMEGVGVGAGVGAGVEDSTAEIRSGKSDERYRNSSTASDCGSGSSTVG